MGLHGMGMKYIWEICACVLEAFEWLAYRGEHKGCM